MREDAHWFKIGWLRDDTGTWHRFGMTVDDAAYPYEPYQLIRQCDGMHGRRRKAMVRLAADWQARDGITCAACLKARERQMGG